ncbi:hypothetical protein LX36DRAFT_731783 [Colletotrichum falcatum]|nr:hypothetical protein LX36DRAFT_731783 [Colletotrichum falcatum]
MNTLKITFKHSYTLRIANRITDGIEQYKGAKVNYTVGWICAITTEFVAVTQNNNNNYTLGKVDNYNIVIAVLPDGEYGTATAAAVARDMLHSFPNIQLGLMVGVRGGALSQKHNIRLGDIVVSSPQDRNSGVFYDRLYKAHLVYTQDTEKTYIELCRDNLLHLILRLVYYRLIALDRLTAKKDVLCFKIEAAGLMNYFLCLIIRGICDYSDLHKNKEWQGFAAMATIAYAKDLLR